ncbi:hypothetical protein ACSAZL_21745 [Methanosarcina sp. T3]|uniref:hypothetical protein n=1 Tax=Methanosarcina sp. T3 TaxID=3439062 RepID=UPI003F8687B7
MDSDLVPEEVIDFFIPQEFFTEKQVSSHNITVILPAYNEDVSIGSVFLFVGGVC